MCKVYLEHKANVARQFGAIVVENLVHGAQCGAQINIYRLCRQQAQACRHVIIPRFY